MDKIIIILSPCSIAIPFLFGFVKYGRLENDLRLIVIFLGFEIFFQIFVATTALMGIKNLWIIHFYTIIEYTFLIIIFLQWQRNLLIRRLMFFSIPLIIALAIFDIVRLENLNMFNTYTRPISSILVLGVLGLTLFEFNKESTTLLSRNPRFWMVPPVFVATTMTITVFAVGNYLLMNFPQTFFNIYRVMMIINMLSNLFYVRVFLCPSQQPKSGG
ncbi:MAG: hypothetical protein HY800_05010 [Ignavibacteriales bacterium]|nr:hypothetical protein [Ignavibacteriales bacterium]